MIHNTGGNERDGEILRSDVRAQAVGDLDRYMARGTLRDGDRIDVTRSAPTFTVGSGNDFYHHY